ncbi:MAG TPA: hypothetical protein VGB19_00410 [Actinomycetota bacterium]
MHPGVGSLRAGPALRMEVGPRLSMNVSPRLLALTSLLQLSSQELEAAIDRESAENPALERFESDACRLCGGEADRPCPRCRPGSVIARRPSGTLLDTTFDVPFRPSPEQSLLEEVRLLLPQEEIHLAEYVVGSLDERGLLPGGTAGIAGQLGIETSRVERVVGALQEVGPPGIGASDIRACLLQQLDGLGAEPPESGIDPEARVRSLARAVVAGHLEALGRGRFAFIARVLNVSSDEVEAAREFIRDHCSPYPSAGLPGGEAPPPVLPDVVVRERADAPAGLEVEVVDEGRFALRVDPLYRLLADMMAASEANQLTLATRRHVRQAVRRAALFMESLEDRNRTLRRIAEHVIQSQRAFVLGGAQYLRRLTRARVAEAIGVHESTVSRAVSGKYVMLPSGRVVPFRDFFDASLGVRDALQHIIEAEEHPLSDRELAGRLLELGYKVARRTVAKYRIQLGLLPRGVRGIGALRSTPA